MSREAQAPDATLADESRGIVRDIGPWLVYLAFRAVESVLVLLPLGAIARVGRALGWLAYWLAGGYRRLAIDNLRIAFGSEMTEPELRRLARRHFASLGGNLLCGFKLPLMEEADIVRRVTAEGLEHPRAASSAGKPIVYAVCHLSCWELLTQVPSVYVFGTKAGSVFQPLSNRFLNARVLRNRQSRGYSLFDRSEGFGGVMKFLRQDKGVLGILVDQHAGDHGVWTPFFNRLCSTTPLAGLLSLRCDAPLIPILIYDNGPGRWTLACLPPIETGEARPTAESLTARMNQVVEQAVRRAPENWFWVHNRWKTPKPEFLLAGYKRGIVMPPDRSVDSLQRFEVLLRSPNWLGDACMAFPAVRALKAGRPDLRLTVLGPEKLRDLWTALPEVDAFIGKHPRQGLFSVAKLIRQAGRFDAAFLLTNSTRSTLEVWLAGIPRRVGYRGSLRSRLIDQITPEPRTGTPPEHQALRYLRMMRHAGASTDSTALFQTGAPVADGTSMLRLGICAGAEYGPAKRWPLERFAEVARQVSARIPQVEWLLFGAPGEKALGEDLSAQLGASVRHSNLVGRTSLRELIAHLRGCRLLVTNDTGTMHLAAALGVPTVAVFGSTEPTLTGPLGDHHTIIRHHVPCSPCFKRECPFGHYECMTAISPARVADAVLTRLQSPPPCAGGSRAE